MTTAERRSLPPAQAPTTAGRLTESFDAWARVLRSPGQPAPADRSLHGAADALPYRPTLRNRMALVRVLDDGGEDGEVVRMRGDRLVIGRSEGEIVIPHDISMSPRHASIERRDDGNWLLSDLGSVQGTFVRVVAARLRHGTVLQIGGTRLRFQAIDLTEGALVEIRAAGDGLRHECHAPSTTIGRSGCDAGIGLDDPFVSQFHATVRRSPRGWRIENAGINGLWVRIEAAVAMTVPSQFQCGEQRFAFQPLV
ncbi:MAG: FHA domain-containing protein [Planctomycetia bacterium]|jgi:pSer/pThr/pTyr-binding forkhead associated (FHA) protein